MKKLAIALASVAALSSLNTASAEITFEQILADPDNIELNRTYALERIQARDIKPALSAIERVIHANPLDLGARLIRAQILIYLGDFALARGELEEGSAVLRAKIDMASPNINLRDPVIYRILHAAHPRTGETLTFRTDPPPDFEGVLAHLRRLRPPQ